MLVHFHASENDRGTPGAGQVAWDETFAALHEIGYDGWIVIEAFGDALPELAAATRIWRRMFESEEQLARDGAAFLATAGVASPPRSMSPAPVPAAIEAELLESFELVDRPAGADGDPLAADDDLDEEFLAAAGMQLRIVANYGAGLDNVDLAAARERGLVVSNTPDVLTDATAEMTIALTLALLRRVAEGDRFPRAARPWAFQIEFMLGASLAGKQFGIVGAGPDRDGGREARRGAWRARRYSRVATTTSAACSRWRTSSASIAR